MLKRKKETRFPGFSVLAFGRFLAGGLVLVPTAVQADEIVMNGTRYPGSRIVGLEEGRLRFRSADGTLRTAWINQIDMVIVDRGGFFADFNRAERFLAGGEPQRAIARYRRTRPLAEEFWPELITMRLLLACDTAGQLDHATLNFIRLLRGRFTGPAAAARLIPEAIPDKRDGKVVRALEQADAALANDPDEAQQALLQLFRYEILRRTGDQRALPAARALAVSSIPQAVQSERAYAILLHAIREAFHHDVEPETLRGLDRAIRDCPRTALPSFLLLKGRTLLRTATSRDEIIRASWPALRVAVHFPDDPRAPEGLYAAALAVERIGLKGKAVELLEECLLHARLTEQTRQLAEAALKRLQSAPAGRG